MEELDLYTLKQLSKHLIHIQWRHCGQQGLSNNLRVMVVLKTAAETKSRKLKLRLPFLLRGRVLLCSLGCFHMMHTQ